MRADESDKRRRAVVAEGQECLPFCLLPVCVKEAGEAVQPSAFSSFSPKRVRSEGKARGGGKVWHPWSSFTPVSPLLPSQSFLFFSFPGGKT